MLRSKLNALVTPKCAVAGLNTKGSVWVRPDLQAEIAYRGVTNAGELRRASARAWPRYPKTIDGASERD